MKGMKIFGVLWAFYNSIMAFLQFFKDGDPGTATLHICIAPVFLLVYLVWKKINQKHEARAVAAEKAEIPEEEIKKSALFKDD